MFGAMILLMVWMSNRQRKAQAEQQKKVAALGVGDEVRTHSGFYGIIADQYDDVVILETESGAQTKWARQAIAGAAAPTGDAGGAQAAAQPEGSDRELGAPADPAPSEERPEQQDGTSRPADGQVPGVTSRGDESGSAR
ncbi:preprotein translocase YidC [Brachybacterium endophyticum]|uniref:Preprotein translocase YidC n=2 Tax=Brachybacterium endophyticum TaxID=2182385 RepID=A0A2U2RJG6_9MICO|nr:preprotein translocase YidC [Brachybacterium endophyticum]